MLPHVSQWIGMAQCLERVASQQQAAQKRPEERVGY
jgi:hypothetical protein